jgi:ferrous iron transport protein B
LVKINLELNQTVDELQKNRLVIQMNEIQMEKKREQLENSYLGRIGHFIEPAIRPLGFEWRTGIALLSGIAAKEVVVSTIGVLLQSDNGKGTDDNRLVMRLREIKHDHGAAFGQPVFTPVTALAFLLFVLIYFPCIGVVSAIAKESGRWRWALFTIGYTTTAAWLVAFLVNQIGSRLF